MAHLVTEQVRLLHLNTRNMLIRDEVISDGTINQASLHVAQVMRRAIELGSASLILVHNHPSGDPTPSRSDIDITRSLAEAGKRVGVSIYDHPIVGTDGFASLRALGLI